MKLSTASLVAAAALLGSTLAGTALGQDTNEQGVVATPEAFNAQQGWNDRSDQDRYRDDSDWDRNGSGRSWAWKRGNILEGRWVADNTASDYQYNYDRGAFRGRGVGDVVLPKVIHIDQKPSVVRIADSKHHPLQLIVLGGKFNSRYTNRPDYLVGSWQGRTLVVERTMRRGATITQTFAVENRGRTLVVRTRREGFGRRAVEITNTYYRA